MIGFEARLNLHFVSLIKTRKSQSSIMMDIAKASHPSFIKILYQPVQNGGFEK